MNDLISVIIPVYKVEKWLDECIESVVNQSYSNLEIILVDDGSPDKCPQKCDWWAQRDSRIRVIHKENGGLSSARNAALEVIKGEYISFVDSDDYIHKDMYKIMLEDIQKTGADIVRCERYIDTDGSLRLSKKIASKRFYNHKEILDSYFYHKDDFCSGVWDKLYKAELFNGVRFPQGINSEDYYVYAIIYNKTQKLYYNDKPLYYYRIRENSICTIPVINEHSFDKIIISDKVYNYIKMNFPEQIEDAKAFRTIAIFSIYYVTLRQKHSCLQRKKWKQDLRSVWKDTMKNKKIGIEFKVKYTIMSLCPLGYVKMKEQLRKHVGYKSKKE